jgi:hypothetical protein
VIDNRSGAGNIGAAAASLLARRCDTLPAMISSHLINPQVAKVRL